MMENFFSMMMCFCRMSSNIFFILIIELDSFFSFKGWPIIFGEIDKKDGYGTRGWDKNKGFESIFWKVGMKNRSFSFLIYNLHFYTCQAILVRANHFLC